MVTFRKANVSDLLLYFEWTNDADVREQSFQNDIISLDNHTTWFNNKLLDSNCVMLVFENELKIPIGQIRFQKENDSAFVIGISVAKEQRGKGYASILLTQSSNYFLEENPEKIINAYIKENNIGSILSFKKAGFSLANELIIEGNKSVLYTKQK
jgi:RimJ/RimL family protein N-acetyltransferase